MASEKKNLNKIIASKASERGPAAGGLPDGGGDASPYYRKRLEAYAYTSGFTLAMVLVIGGIGYLLDLKFGTGHRYFFLGIILSYPLTQYYLYRKFRPKR